MSSQLACAGIESDVPIVVTALPIVRLMPFTSLILGQGKSALTPPRVLNALIALNAVPIRPVAQFFSDYLAKKKGLKLM